MREIKLTEKLFLWSIIIISSSFFGLYNTIYNYTQIYYTDAIGILIIVISFMYGLCHFSSLSIKIPKKRKVDRYAYLFLLWIFIEIIVTYFRYSNTQNIVVTIKESIFCIAPMLAYFQFREVISKQEKLEYFIDILIKVATICSVVAIMALIVYTRTGNNIAGLDVDNYSFIRNGRGHFMIGSMVVIPATIFLWCRIVNGNYRFRYFVALFINMVHIIYVGQTRMVIATTLFTMIIAYVIVSRRSKGIKVTLLLLSAILLVIGEYHTIQIGLDKLLGDNSVIYRMQGISFYIDQVIHNPIFGMGFISSSNTSLSSLLYGPLNIFYRTDVGFVGFINCLGIIGGIWYISFLLYALKRIVNARRKMKQRMYVYSFSFVFFIIVSSINLFPIDGFRILYFPLLMTMIYIVERIKE